MEEKKQLNSAMACVVVSSLLGIVEQLQLLLLQKPPLNNNNLPDDAQIMVSTLKDKLHFLHAYLHKSNPYLDEAVKRVDEEIRDVAIKAEDEIESKLGEIYQLQGEGVAVKACEDLHQSLEQLVKDFECVEVQIRDLQMRHIFDDASSFSSSTPSCLQLQNVRYGVSSSSSNYDLENTMIGMEGDVEKIKSMLIQTSLSTKPQVVLIVGDEGTGRTTLAKKVYEDPSIVSHFDIQAWTVKGELHSKRNILIDILSCIVSLSNEEISKQDDEQLAQQLRKLLMGQRYFIVIDGLSSETEWNDIIRYFPRNSNGSRFLITTEIGNVAKFASSSDMWIFETRYLNPEESWKLLSKTATSNGKWSSVPPEFEKIGRCIVQKCRGIPLVIVLIGGLLATLNSTRQWADIETHFNNRLDDNDPFSLLFDTIEFCYNYLPRYLKACFLYLGAFPVGNEIDVKKLIKLWIAEGFFKPEMNKSPEERAEEYLHDLINRRLVQVHKRNLDGKIKSCMLHDALYYFCLENTYAKEYSTMSLNMGGCNYFHGQPRWVSIQASIWPISPNFLMNSSFKIRSVLYFGENLYLAKCWLIFSPLKLLRVLDLSLLKYWHGMPSEIVNLVHLRYLALTTIGCLYNFQLFKLQRLQTLILSSWTKECQLQLPCNVLDLPWLRHVRYDKGCSSYLPNMVQENLQTLSWFKVTSEDSRTTNFKKVPNLKELGIYIEGEVLSNTLHNLAQLCQLEKLKVKMGRVERFNLPNSFPPNLKQLTLSNTYLSWEDMDIIGKLPNLDLLKLKDFAFCGPEWTPKDGEFLQLRFFLIERSDLEHWNANANHFPVLERLVLRYCWDLKKLPNDFEKVYTLRSIELDNCCSSLMTSTMDIQQAQRVSGNEALVVRDVTKVVLPTNDSSGKKV